MTPDEQSRPSGRPSIDDQLREALGGPAYGETFDHDALVAGVKRRARGIRRRRAATAAVATAVLLPTLAGTGWVLGNRLMESGGRGVDVTVATRTQTASPTPLPSPQPDDEATTSGPVTTSPIAPTPTPTDPPWQSTEPPEPVSPDDGSGLVPNRIELPDARPVGIEFLDAFGGPEGEFVGPRQMPLGTFMAGNLEPGIEPHSGVQWFYYDDGNAIDQDSLELIITAWDDGAEAMELVRAGSPDLSARWIGDGAEVIDPPEPQPWPGHEDDDHLLVGVEQALENGSTHQLGGAVVRHGDYLVGVTVRASPGDGGVDTQDEAVAVAAEIAQKTADNLAYLDPEGGAER